MTRPDDDEIDRDYTPDDDVILQRDMAIEAIGRMGHTPHCAMRIAWGDGECECRPREVRPQPSPAPATGDVWLDLVDAVEVPDRLRLLMLARRRQGIERYGVPLQRDNGRDHAADALQEALDGAVYCEAMGRRDLAAEFLGLAGKLMAAGDATGALPVAHTPERPTPWLHKAIENPPPFDGPRLPCADEPPTYTVADEEDGET